jgi:hypothetical protein
VSLRPVLVLVVLLAVGLAGGLLAWPDGERELSAQERHAILEEREEALMESSGATRARVYAEPPYASQNSDGTAGAGGQAVAYRAGQRVVSDPAVVAAAPEARLWRTGFGSWEPTIGVNKRGTVFFSARNTNADPGVAISDDGGRTWRRAIPPNHTSSLDPYIWLDEATGRLFASDIDPPVTCTPVSRSDDDGKTWRYSRACGVTDHQNHFGGPPPANGDVPEGYPNVLYYCAISGGALSDSSTITGCLKSLDGGQVWTLTGEPAYPPKRTENGWCDGAAGHGTVAPNGYVYVPRGWCGPPTIAISKDEGATWTHRRVSDRTMINHESGIAADSAGNLYYVFVGDDHRAYLAISRDAGNTWSDERDVTPPGVAYVSAFAAHADAGSPGRLAMVFMGTADAEPVPGDAEDPAKGSRWGAYMISTTDALAEDPLFYAAPANDPQADTLWKGVCDDLRCGNLGDFLDVEIGPDGSVWTALMDSCPGADECIYDLEEALVTPRGEGVVGQLVGGAPLAGTIEEQTPQISLPAAEPRRCRRRRPLTIRLRQPKRGRIVALRVYVNGTRVRVRGKRLARRVRIGRLPRGRSQVRVVARTANGRRVQVKRRYRTCR